MATLCCSPESTEPPGRGLSAQRRRPADGDAGAFNRVPRPKALSLDGGLTYVLLIRPRTRTRGANVCKHGIGLGRQQWVVVMTRRAAPTAMVCCNRVVVDIGTSNEDNRLFMYSSIHVFELEMGSILRLLKLC